MCSPPRSLRDRLASQIRSAKPPSNRLSNSPRARRYFRHNKYSSFQRQLNYFNFRKTSGKGKNTPCIYVNDDLGADLASLVLLKRKKNLYKARQKQMQMASLPPNMMTAEMAQQLQLHHQQQEQLAQCAQQQMHIAHQAQMQQMWVTQQQQAPLSTTSQVPLSDALRMNPIWTAQQQQPAISPAPAGGGGNLHNFNSLNNIAANDGTRMYPVGPGFNQRGIGFVDGSGQASFQAPLQITTSPQPDGVGKVVVVVNGQEFTKYAPPLAPPTDAQSEAASEPAPVQSAVGEIKQDVLEGVEQATPLLTLTNLSAATPAATEQSVAQQAEPAVAGKQTAHEEETAGGKGKAE